MRHNLMSRSAPFAHLLGLARKPSGEAPKDTSGDDDTVDVIEDPAEPDEVDDDLDGKKGRKGKKKGKAAGDEPDADDDEPDDPKDDDRKTAFKAGAVAERARCRAIFAADAAGKRPDLAAQLAFATDLAASAAIGVLDAAAAGHSPRSGLAERMAATPLANPGADGVDGDKGPSLAAQIIAAGKKRRGEV